MCKNCSPSRNITPSDCSPTSPSATLNVCSNDRGRSILPSKDWELTVWNTIRRNNQVRSRLSGGGNSSRLYIKFFLWDHLRAWSRLSTTLLPKHSQGICWYVTPLLVGPLHCWWFRDLILCSWLTSSLQFSSYGRRPLYKQAAGKIYLSYSRGQDGESDTFPARRGR